MPSRSVAPYRPRAAEHTVLHALVRDHLATFLRAADADGRGLPAFVEQEFRDFLTCGVWSHGFARFKCTDCRTERLVPFSCKGRAIWSKLPPSPRSSSGRSARPVAPGRALS